MEAKEIEEEHKEVEHLQEHIIPKIELRLKEEKKKKTDCCEKVPVDSLYFFLPLVAITNE